MIRSDAGRCPVSARCGILGVAKSAYCWMPRQPEAERVDPYKEDVGRVWRDGGRVYGAGKIRAALEHERIVMLRRRICRIMRAGGMTGSFAAPRFPLGDIEVFLTDRGGGFAGERIERMLDMSGITRSLSRPGTPYDNAVAESANRLVRKELIYDNVHTSVERLRSDLNRHVWRYNHQWLHSTLGYLSPVEFTQQGNTL